jgi:DNA-directed RNA polymerase specialized sigma24 family protein
MPGTIKKPLRLKPSMIQRAPEWLTVSGEKFRLGEGVRQGALRPVMAGRNAERRAGVSFIDRSARGLRRVGDFCEGFLAPVNFFCLFAKFSPNLPPERALPIEPMHQPASEPDDETIARWIVGSLEEREWVLNAAWRRYAAPLLGWLEDKFAAIPWADRKDIADHAFPCLWSRLAAGEFTGDGLGCTFSFLCEVAKHKALDFLKKSHRRSRHEEELAMREQDRVDAVYCATVVRKEFEMLRQDAGDAVVAKLIERARAMKPAQRAVSGIMVEIFANTGRWPANERLLERMRELEPQIQLNTIKERRKEVLAKFKPILNGSHLEDL